MYRWLKRLDNYEKALVQLRKAVLIYKQKEINELEQQGLIKAFEYTFELSWNLMKDYLIFQGISGISGSRDTIKNAFKFEIIEDDKVWLEMIEARNLTTHTYDEELAKEIAKKIVDKYYSVLEKLLKKFKQIREIYEKTL
ncbi:MAG: nucleotidyltransferase substrate binding protein [Candidatus Calescibacterium sp.]|nr:nucleotidyltransferase substrate binding protein [Candidatus Calescibacterium sp.]MCX7759264.1 nucleotidyltransferase substrate binding protein [bacterium]MDW8195913.1 nucleotidyltransferase substrate binding protein [Candidatus Calescibacterium sp.]